MFQILKDIFLVKVNSSDESWLFLKRKELKTPSGYNVLEAEFTYYGTVVFSSHNPFMSVY